MKKFLILLSHLGLLVTGVHGQVVDLIDLENGYCAAVRNRAVAPSYLKILREDPEIQVLVHDPVTGVVLCQSSQQRQIPFADRASSSTGQTLYHLVEQNLEPIARIVGQEKRKGGKVLPLSYLRFRSTGLTLPSGTLLYNEQGHLVGIVYINDRLIAHQGYAVPIQAVQRVARDYAKNNSVTRGWIGIVTTTTTNVPEIASVRPDSPAALAGLKKGDILVRVGEWEVSSYLDVVNAFYYLIAGEAEAFRVMRGTELKTYTLTPIAWQSLQQ